MNVYTFDAPDVSGVTNMSLFAVFLQRVMGSLQAMACWPGWGETGKVWGTFPTTFVMLRRWALHCSVTKVAAAFQCCISQWKVALWPDLLMCRFVTEAASISTPTTIPIAYHCMALKWEKIEVMTWIKVKEGCTSPTLLSHHGIPVTSSKMVSRWLETGLGAVDDLGISSTWPSSEHSLVLCFSYLCGHCIRVISSTQLTEKSLPMLG